MNIDWIYVCVCIHVCMCSYCVYVCMCMCGCIRTHVCICERVRMCMCVCVHVYLDIYLYVCVYLHSHCILPSAYGSSYRQYFTISILLHLSPASGYCVSWLCINQSYYYFYSFYFMFIFFLPMVLVTSLSPPPLPPSPSLSTNGKQHTLHSRYFTHTRDRIFSKKLTCEISCHYFCQIFIFFLSLILLLCCFYLQLCTHLRYVTFNTNLSLCSQWNFNSSVWCWMFLHVCINLYYRTDVKWMSTNYPNHLFEFKF